MTEPQQPAGQPWSEADLPILTEIDDANAASADGVEIPDFDFSAEMDDIKQHLGTADAPVLEFPPELLLDDVVPADPPVTASGVALDFGGVPSLDLDAYATAPIQDPGLAHDFEFELEPASPVVAPQPQTAGALDIADLSVPALAPEDEIPDLSLDSPAPTGSAAAPTADIVPDMPVTVPELSLDDALPEAADAVPLAGAEPMPAEAVPTADEPLEPMPAAAMQRMAVQPDSVDAMPTLAAADLPQENVDHADLAPAETAVSAPAEPAPAETPTEAPADPALGHEEDVAETVVAAEMPPPVDPDASAALASSLAETHDDADVLAAAVAAGTGSGAAGLTPAAGEADSTPFRSISLDSLPRGVLGGGMALAAAEAESQAPSVQDMIRAAEKTLAEERLKQALQQAREDSEAAASAVDLAPDAASAQPAAAPTEAEPVPAATVAEEAAVPQSPVPSPSGETLPVSAAEPHKPVEIINVAGLASSPAPQSYNLPPVRKSYVTLVDEAMLIDSLYDKILPRMKVELSLWLQDALDHQAKQMLSGVMHQLKEDYEMLFSETLRESLRQAIAEMNREDRERH